MIIYFKSLAVVTLACLTLAARAEETATAVAPSSFQVAGDARLGSHLGRPFIGWWEKSGVVTVPFEIERLTAGASPRIALEADIAVGETSGGIVLIALSKNQSPGGELLKVWETPVSSGQGWDKYSPNHFGSIDVAESGKYYLHFSAKQIRGEALMNLSFLRLLPATPEQISVSPPAKPAPATFQKKFGEGMGNSLEAEVKSVAGQLATFTLPEGFVIENVSHEGLGLIKPISLRFDDAGRLWTQTASEYPLDQNPAGFLKEGEDKILVIDQPCLPAPQRPRVFADGLVMPISVLPHDHGVYVIVGTNLYFLQDNDGDGKADKRSLLLSGFGVKDSHTCAHHLTRTPGGWIVFSQGVHSTGEITMADGKMLPLSQALVARFRQDGTGLEVIGEGFNNIWAWALNKEGRTYIHEANDLGYSQVAFERDSTYPSFLATASGNPLIHPPTAQDLGLDGTGFCGIACGGESSRDFPEEWQNKNFVANPITGEINTVSYTVDELGNHRFTREQDLVRCSDPMFRPVNVSFGPDGCLYIVDWYNRSISHGTTTRNLDKHDRVSGRIWRVRHHSQPAYTAIDVEGSSSDKLIAHLRSKNLWEMRAAVHQIGKRQADQLIPELADMVASAEVTDSVRIHALWALENLRYFSPTLWNRLLESSNQNVRYEALRSLSAIQPQLAQVFPLLLPLKDERSQYVLNELVRFFRDTPQTLSPQHLDFARSFQTADADLASDKITAWKHRYFALGGAYEKRFLNQLIASIGKERSVVPLADEKRWGQVIGEAPNRGEAETGKLDAKIKRLAKLFASAGRGDLGNGKSQFGARCAACHGDRGFAPPINRGAGNNPLEVLTAILKPGDAIEEIFRSYRVIKCDGTTIEGFRSNLTDKAITLTFMGGGTLTIPLDEIDTAGYISGKSVMLESLTADLSDQDYIDLLSYLITPEGSVSALPQSAVRFEKIKLHDKYITEGASVGDINGDGDVDIVAGPLWWQGPEFERPHSYAPVKTFPVSAYCDNFFTFPALITKDDWVDILRVGLPAEASQLAINPGESPLPPGNQQHTCAHCLAQAEVCNESPQFLDLIGDQQKELLSFSNGQITLGIPEAEPGREWQRIGITPRDPKRFPKWIHGLGAGDINGDGLQDVLENKAWWEQPVNWDQKSPWIEHPFSFAPRQGGAQMFAYDIDGDGDNDVVTALNAHSWGMAWYEQVKDAGQITFKKHTVMTDKPEGNPYGVSFSQPHAMDCADIDGDGIKDVVTGKCYLAHNGKDPGSGESAVLYWFRTSRHEDGSAELIPYLIDDDSGVGRQITLEDVNADGKVDVIVGNKKGVFLFRQY